MKLHLRDGGYDWSEERDDSYAACSPEDADMTNWNLAYKKDSVTCKRCLRIIKRRDEARQNSAEFSDRSE